MCICIQKCNFRNCSCINSCYCKPQPTGYALLSRLKPAILSSLIYENQNIYLCSSRVETLEGNKTEGKVLTINSNPVISRAAFFTKVDNHKIEQRTQNGPSTLQNPETTSYGCVSAYWDSCSVLDSSEFCDTFSMTSLKTHQSPLEGSLESKTRLLDWS